MTTSDSHPSTNGVRKKARKPKWYLQTKTLLKNSKGEPVTLYFNSYLRSEEFVSYLVHTLEPHWRVTIEYAVLTKSRGQKLAGCPVVNPYMIEVRIFRTYQGKLPFDPCSYQTPALSSLTPISPKQRLESSPILQEKKE